MGRSANLSEEAYSVLKANKEQPGESLSRVILRLVPRPIRTFEDLEKHLDSLDDCVFDKVDTAALRKNRKGNRAH
jgi:predicted CopG family antitoxin